MQGGEDLELIDVWISRLSAGGGWLRWLVITPTVAETFELTVE